MTLAAVCLLDTYNGGHETLVMDGGEYRENSVRMMMAARHGIIGRMEEAMLNVPYARACVIEDFGSLTRDNLDVYGTPLAEAWCAAFSEYLESPKACRFSEREGGITIVNTDKGEYFTERGFKPSPLPLLLFVGTAKQCDSPYAGRWAFDRLVACRTRPTERDGLTDVSQVVQWQ